MKAIDQQQINPFLFFKQNKKTTSRLSILLSFLILHLTVGCSYYKVREVNITKENISSTIEEFNTQGHYAIINQTWHLENLVVNEDERTIQGRVTPLPFEHQDKKARWDETTYRYKKYKKEPLNELHFTIDSSISISNGEELTVPFNKILALSLNDKNRSRAAGNVFLGTVGVLAGLFLIIALTKSSCPFVYIKNGEEYVFTGELYPGTITANLERDDYLPLPNFKAENNEFVLKVTNELKEIQYTDLLNLLVVEHEKDLKVLLDKNGTVQTFTSLSSPKTMSTEGKEEIESILEKDGQFYLFDGQEETTNSTRKVVFTFDRPMNSHSAKLLLTAKNSFWLDFVFGQFNKQFGSYYNKFQKDQQKVPKEKIQQWATDQNIPLSIYVKSNNKWKLIDQINTVGPMATRDIAIPIAFENNQDEPLEILLETGFMFWELDYIGIDYSDTKPLNITTLEPSLAIDENDRVVTDILKKADHNYFKQPSIGNEVVVTFTSKTADSSLNRSVFLKNRGYYNYIRNYEGVPDLSRLKSFKEKNRFTRFAENEYKALMAFDNPNNISL
ncbi:hypothetical protein GGR42_000351 [Saonia flava]|uniref:Uncharacterized protein n=1 Tax=Saonia flava TaxID=523696 RepID=A0A846QZ61_9FLAO|nr:hypothetical protein [Saonia flava]NJB69889.1 hypothetical protein [Saonia flava]